MGALTRGRKSFFLLIVGIIGFFSPFPGQGLLGHGAEDQSHEAGDQRHGAEGISSTRKDQTPEDTRRILRIVGSSAMYPVLTAVAERFGYEKAALTPVVEATGTGGGLKFFCASADIRSPSLAAASRPMTPQEKAYCHKNGVTAVLEIPLGLDGIVVVTPKDGPPPLRDVPEDLTLGELLGAVAGSPHPPAEWSEVNPLFPPTPIKILVPSTASGTREAFESLVLKGATARRDWAYISAADQEAVLVQKLLKTKGAVGVLSYAYLQKNKKVLTALRLNGVAPTRESIRTRSYPLVRPVYLYVKGAHLQDNPALEAFVRYVVSPDSRNLLEENGLIPLKEKNQNRRRETLERFFKKLRGAFFQESQPSRSLSREASA